MVTTVKKVYKINLVAFALLAGLMGGGLSKVAAATSQIKLDGSSTVFPIAEAVSEDFQAKHKDVRVTVGTSGTGGGFKKFTAKEVDIANASRTIKDNEQTDAKKNNVSFIELPVAIDGLTVVVHPNNSFLKSITKADLKRIWEPQSKIQTWQDLNPSFPKEKIVLFGPGPDSGTFDYFTEEVMGKAKSSRSDFTASEDDNVLVKGIAGSKYALGYFGHGYYMANKSKVKAVALDWGKGPIEPTDDNIKSKSYGLARTLYIYVNSDSAKRPEIKEYVTFFLDQAPSISHETGYLPLTQDEYKRSKERFAKGTIGTAHPGSDKKS
jgi:phosphate transport system substrate-binding protein